MDTKDKSRRSRVKCSGEVPSCKTCLDQGKQCEGYRVTKRKRARSDSPSPERREKVAKVSHVGSSTDETSTRNELFLPNRDTFLSENSNLNHLFLLMVSLT